MKLEKARESSSLQREIDELNELSEELKEEKAKSEVKLLELKNGNELLERELKKLRELNVSGWISSNKLFLIAFVFVGITQNSIEFKSPRNFIFPSEEQWLGGQIG